MAGPLGAAGGGAAEGGVALHTLATAALQPAGAGAATTWTFTLITVSWIVDR